MNGETELATSTDPLEASGVPRGDLLPPIDYFQLALKYKGWLTAGFVGGLLLGIAIYLKLGPAYEATTRILVSKKVPMPIRDGETATYGERAQHIALIMSPFIVGKALEMHQLDKLPSLAKSKDPVEDILDSLVVKRSAGHDQSFLNIIDISCRNPNKRDAQKVVSAIVDAYRSYLSESTEEHMGEVVELITKANTELLQQLRQKEREYLAFRESAPLRWRTPPGAESTPNDVTNIHLETLEAIEAEQRKNLLKRTELKSKIKTLEEAAASGQSQRSLELLARLLVANSGRATAGTPAVAATAGSLETQLVPLLTERQKLLRDYGPDHPKVQAVQESIETVVAFYRSRGVVVPEGLLENVHPRAKTGPETTQQEGLFAAYLESLRQQLAELDYRDKQLAELHARESKLAKELARYQAQDQTFHDDIARIKALWDVVVRRLNELNLIKNSQGYTLKQIAPVRVKLLTKRIIKFLGAGLFCGLGLVVSLIVFQERRDTTLKTVDEIQHAVRSPVLGAVPRFDAGPVTAEGADSLGAALCYYYRPASLEAEAYRSIRTTLLSQLAETGRKVIQVSSPEPGDGKTTLACNLALAIAQTGKRVLLIDADLRRPRIHALFGLDREVGLVEVVGREIDLLTAAKETAVPNLFVLTAGTAVAPPAELLSDVGLAEMLAVARREFDIVLIDAPPVLIVSDTCIIAQHTDGLLLVLQVGKNRRATVKRALERLQANHIPVLGAIANALDAKSEDGYGYGYGYEDAYVDYASPAVGEDQSASVDPPGPAAPDEPGEMISANAASPRL